MTLAHSHHHAHQHHPISSYRLLLVAIILIFSFAVVEALAGWWANSLALLSDAGHMFSDSLALGIAALATWISQKPPSKKHSYGLGRAEVIAAWVSSLLMIVISIAVMVEAVHRLHAPPQVKSGTVMAIATLGLFVNLLVATMLTRGERTLNLRAALLHVMGDILGSMAALISGAILYFTHWLLVDPILSIVIGLLIILASLNLLRESLFILMEAVPKHLNYHDVLTTMSAVTGVKAIHDLHIWTLSSGKVALSAHVDLHEMEEWPAILESLHEVIENRFSISHLTLQPEADLTACHPCNDPTDLIL